MKSAGRKGKSTGSSGLGRVLRCICALLLCVALGATLVFGWYFPHYLIRKEVVEITPDDGSIRIMSCNLRCLTPLDLGKKNWFYRADLIIDNIEENAPGIIGFQEATCWQYDYLVDTLVGYDSVITYRDSTFNSEGCPIFYNTALYTLIDKGSFWLSETPELMSKDWDAACYRICSYVILKENASGQSFVVFNTHLDHISDEARINGIAVVLDKIAQFGDLPSVIMGDFNAVEGSETYISATESFLDANHQAAVADNRPTYQNWGNPLKSKRIDYFMISKSGFSVESYSVISAERDGVYSSDHNPILLVLSFDENEK